MTLEEGLVSHLTADSDVTDLVSTRIYPQVVPQDASLPAAAYQRISGPRDHSHSGATGLAQARMQFSYQGGSYSEAKSVAEAVRDSLDGFSGTMGTVNVNACLLVNEMDGWGETFEKPTVRHDYMIWYQE